MEGDTSYSEQSEQNKGSVGQEQIHDLLFSDSLSWQAIIYDLINTEQLNPWAIDVEVLSQKYLERIKDLEEANFFVSSKVLLAASLLLRIKSEILLNRDIQSLDDILFGKKEEKKSEQTKIEFDEDVPDLIPRTPLPRLKKVSLNELMEALGKAIKTETRRIKRVVVDQQQKIETAISMPKKTINIQDRIKDVYARLESKLKGRSDRFSFSEFVDSHNIDKLSTFVPLLHLDNQHKVYLEQENHLEEIWIWLKKMYESKNYEILQKFKKEVEDYHNGNPEYNESSEDLGEEDSD